MVLVMMIWHGAGDDDMNGAGDDMEVDVPSIAASDRPGTMCKRTLSNQVCNY